MKKLDVLIYFEHIVRELDACMILKYELEKMGLTAEIVSTHRNRYWNFVKYQPKMLVVPFLFADKDDIAYKEFKEMYGDVEILNLHHEQLYNKMTKYHFMPKNDVSKNSYHLSWGDIFAQALMTAGVESRKIVIAGNPRTDDYYYNAVDLNKYIKDYKELIFVPMSFAWAFLDESYFLEKGNLDPLLFREQKEITIKSAELFLISIRKLARNYPEKLFVLRPHPFEKDETYTKYLSELDDNPLEKNIVILQEGNVYDWIKESELVIGWLTTVSLEASIFEKKNVIYNPIELPAKMKTDFMNLYDEIVTDYNTLNSIVGNLDNYKFENIKLKKHLHESMGVADGKVNYRIARFINSILNKSNLQQKIHFRYIVNLFKAMFIDNVKNLFIRLGILSKIIPFYNGIEKELLSYDNIEDAYYDFLKRNNLREITSLNK